MIAALCAPNSRDMPQSANPTLPLPEAQHRPVLALAIRFFAGLALATMLMLVKLGNLVQFEFGFAVWAFVTCVTMSMIASICFDPHSIWDDDNA